MADDQRPARMGLTWLAKPMVAVSAAMSGAKVRRATAARKRVGRAYMAVKSGF